MSFTLKIYQWLLIGFREVGSQHCMFPWLTLTDQLPLGCLCSSHNQNGPSTASSSRVPSIGPCLFSAWNDWFSFPTSVANSGSSFRLQLICQIIALTTSSHTTVLLTQGACSGMAENVYVFSHGTYKKHNVPWHIVGAQTILMIGRCSPTVSSSSAVTPDPIL